MLEQKNYTEQEIIEELIAEKHFDSCRSEADCYIFNKDGKTFKLSKVSFRMMLSLSVNSYQPNWVLGVVSKVEYVADRIKQDGIC